MTTTDPTGTVGSPATTGLRDGKGYLAALRDDREIYVDGERVDDVTTHAAFAPAAHTVAELYDLAAAPDSDMRAIDPETGAETNRIYLTPRST
jgi:4-hydroxyphenylacetate 3-monooxygenase